MTTKFETGKTYQASMICDHNCIVKITVARRTAQTLVTTEGKRLRITLSTGGGEEMVYPDGHYSMATIIGATDTKVILTDWQREALARTQEIPAQTMAQLVCVD